jgi:hypothetical protein
MCFRASATVRSYAQRQGERQRHHAIANRKKCPAAGRKTMSRTGIRAAPWTWQPCSTSSTTYAAAAGQRDTNGVRKGKD